MATGTYDLNGGSFVADSIPGRLPKNDKKGYPTYKGYPAPVLVGVTVVDTTP